MVEPVVAGIGGGTDILVLTTNKLNPVSIGIFGECDVPHPTLGKLLLEGIPGILDSLAGGLDVVNGDGNVSKSTVRFGVSIGHTVVGVTLGAVVVGEFEDGVTVGKVAVTLKGIGAVVRQEVKGEFIFGEIEVLDLVKT